MPTVFTWKILELERETVDGYVFVANYIVNADDGSYTTSAYGSVELERPENMIPYADLTEDLVVAWVKEALGGEDKVAAIEAVLQRQLDEQRIPTKAVGLPWSN